MSVAIGIVVAIAFFLIIVLASAIRVLREYERGVIFRLGRLIAQKGPGLIFLIPIIDRMVRVDLRTIVMDVPSQDVISRDNVSVKVNAVVYFHVMDPSKAIVRVENYMYATSQLSQTTLRSVLGQATLDELLAEREKLNDSLQEILDRHTDPWGIKVTMVEVKAVDLPIDFYVEALRLEPGHPGATAGLETAKTDRSQREKMAADLVAGAELQDARVYASVNNGVYRAGFATTQEAYDEAFRELFATLDTLEERLSRHRYLVGDRLTEADWRLFTTLARFDPVYFGHFKCNLRPIADYPNLSNYLRDLYQVPGVAGTVNMHHIKAHYYGSHRNINPTGIVPLGPTLDHLDQPHDRARLHAAA